jgi:hypothetical protein
MMEGKYTIELCPPGAIRAGVEGIIASDDDLATARKLYRAATADNPGRVVILCQSGRVLARSDERDTMPSRDWGRAGRHLGDGGLGAERPAVTDHKSPHRYSFQWKETPVRLKERRGHEPTSKPKSKGVGHGQIRTRRGCAFQHIVA